MLLKIYDHEKIDEIQDKFNECFPYLKIEFYHQPHKWHEGSPLDDLIQPGSFIEDIRKTHETGILSIKSWDKTGHIEQEFKRMFNLNVQIFRLQKDKWVQTIDSDELTLKEQSDLAKSSQEPKNHTAHK
jgi:hypothetical protein